MSQLHKRFISDEVKELLERFPSSQTCLPQAGTKSINPLPGSGTDSSEPVSEKMSPICGRPKGSLIKNSRDIIAIF